MTQTMRDDIEIRRKVFNAYLKKAQGKSLTKTQKALIEAWEYLGKLQPKPKPAKTSHYKKKVKK
jgi:hypothetical protein